MKDNNDFLSKFSDRIEAIGKEGVRGIMKKTNIQINPTRNSIQGAYTFTSPNNCYQRSLPNINNPGQPPNLRYAVPQNGYLPYVNTHSNRSTTVTQSNQYGFNLQQEAQSTAVNSLIHKPTSFNSLHFAEWRRYPNVMPIADQVKKREDVQPYIEKHRIAQERLYQPYSLGDYRKLRLDIKLGGLGPNVGTKEWAKREVRRNKMGLYGSSIMKERIGLYNITTETPNEERTRVKQERKELSIRYRTSNYGKRIKLKSPTASSNANDPKQAPHKLTDNDFHEVLSLNRKKYFERLALLRESLVSNY